MKIIPINNHAACFRSCFPITGGEIDGYCGEKWAPYMKQAMSDLNRVAYTEGDALDIIVRTIKSDNLLEKGISILIAKESDISSTVSYIRHGISAKCPHVLKNINVENDPQIDMWSKVVCDTVKSMIKTFKQYH